MRRLFLRPGLRWTLGISVALAICAMWWPAGQDPTASMPARDADFPKRDASFEKVTEQGSALPVMLPRHVFDKADFDPFVGLQPEPPRVAPVKAVVAVPVESVPVTETAPPLNYRFLGQMTDPSGKRWVYLTKGDQPVTVTVGAQLEEGYVVEGIDAEGVRLRYPPLDAPAVVPVRSARNQ